MTITENTLPAINELRVYTKRNKVQEGKVPESTKPCHESIPAPNVQKLTGNEISVPIINTDTELPITLRKGSRTCTKHLIQDYILFGKLFSKHHACICEQIR